MCVKSVSVAALAEQQYHFFADRKNSNAPVTNKQYRRGAKNPRRRFLNLDCIPPSSQLRITRLPSETTKKEPKKTNTAL